jgi:hypothetical protein
VDAHTQGKGVPYLPKPKPKLTFPIHNLTHFAVGLSPLKTLPSSVRNFRTLDFFGFYKNGAALQHSFFNSGLVWNSVARWHRFDVTIKCQREQNLKQMLTQFVSLYYTVKNPP